MSKWLSKWLLIGFGFVLFVGCGGGGSGSSSNTSAKEEIVKLNPNTVLIDSNLSTEISETTFENNITELRVSDKFANSIKEGEVLHIPSGMDKRFPIGFSGKVDKIENNKITISQAELSDVISELKIDKKSFALNDENFVGIITPSYVQATNKSKDNLSRRALNKNERSFLDGGIILTSLKQKRDRRGFPGADNEYNEYNQTTVHKLEFGIKLLGDSNDNIKNKQELSLKLEGSLSNYGYGFGADIDENNLEFSAGAWGDLTANLKLEGKGTFSVGKYNKKWDETEKATFDSLGVDLKLMGLGANDKIGKIPLLGLVYTLSTPTVIRVVNDIDNLSKADKGAAVIIWVYINFKGEVELSGEMGVKTAVSFEAGVDKENGEFPKMWDKQDIVENIDDDTPVLEAPYLQGELKIKGTVGLSVESDLLLGGLRFINAGVFMGAVYEQSFQTGMLNVSRTLKDFKKDTEWEWKYPTDGTFCTEGNLDAGAKFNAKFNFGVEGTVWGLEASVQRSKSLEYPTADEIKKLKDGERKYAWMRLGTNKYCYNLPKPSELNNNHVDSYRQPITSDALKLLSDENYKYAYLSNRVYADNPEDEGKIEHNWKTIELRFDKIKGFKAGLYTNTITGENIVAYGGTTANSYENKVGQGYDALVDFLTDISLLGVISFGQPSSALDFYNKAGSVDGITGHSLGGGLAQYAGLYSGVKTVTFNSAPLPFNMVGSFTKFADKIVVEDAGIVMKSIKFDNQDMITNIMTPYDPISTVSTAIMSLDESNVGYLMGARFMLGISPNNKLDFLLTGEKIYIPVANQGGAVNFANHSMDLIEQTFLENTNYNMEFDSNILGDSISIDNLTLKDRDGNTVSIIEIPSTSWVLYTKDGKTKIKEGNSDDALEDIDNGVYKLTVNAQLKDGRVVSNSNYIIMNYKENDLSVTMLEEKTAKKGDNVILQAQVTGNTNNLELTYFWSEDETIHKEGTTIDDTISLSKNDWSVGEHYIEFLIRDSKGNIAMNYMTLTITDDGVVQPINGSSKIKKTGQTTSYTDYDDGYYQIGVAHNYERVGEIVKDHITGLEWQDDSEAKTIKKSWEDAKTHCSNKGNGWRLPNSVELESIVDYGKYNPSLNSIFENFSSSYYWSSTTHKHDSNDAWLVNFNDGHVLNYTKGTNYYVRCVRAGE